VDNGLLFAIFRAYSFLFFVWVELSSSSVANPSSVADLRSLTNRGFEILCGIHFETIGI
jgi:hypothetical protein